MKKIFLAAGVGITAVAAAACSGGGGGGKSVGTGTYLIANALTNTDGCQLGDFSGANGDTISVTATGSTISSDFDFFTAAQDATVTGSTFAITPLTSTIDWTDSAASGLSMSYNCQETDTYTLTGTITGSNKFSDAIGVTYDKTAGNNAECIAANNSAFGLALTTWPCNSTFSSDASKQ